MDDIDRRLIGLLRDNGRASVAALAKQLGVARGTVQNRLARLQADGTIVGYSVRLKPQHEEQRIRGLMTVAVEGNRAEAVLKALRERMLERNYINNLLAGIERELAQ